MGLNSEYTNYTDIDLLIITSMYKESPSDAIDAFEIFLSRHGNFINSICNIINDDLFKIKGLRYGIEHNSIYQLFFHSNNLVNHTEKVNLKHYLVWTVCSEFAKLVFRIQNINSLNFPENQNKIHLNAKKKKALLKKINLFFKHLTAKEVLFFNVYIQAVRISKYIQTKIDYSILAKNCFTTRINFIATLKRIRGKLFYHFNYNNTNMEDIILYDWNEPLLVSGNTFPITREEILIFEKEVNRYHIKSQETIDLLEVLSKGKYVPKRRINEELELKIAARGEDNFLSEELKKEILESLKEIKLQNESNLD